jgi:DNA-binding beta-propeller fold protein YncE
MKKYASFVFALLVLQACVKDKPQNPVLSNVQLSNARKVYVVNEGVFPNGNASVSLYDPGSGEVVEDIYAAKNNKAAVGDVAQSLSYINGSYYLVVNNSGKILICDRDFKKTAEISQIGSPRYVLPVTNQKAYVSDYSSHVIHIIDLNTHLKTGSISCPGWTEQMALIYNTAFVANIRRNYLYVINTVTDVVFDSIPVGLNVAGIVLDRRDKLWALSPGDQPKGVPAKLHRINPLNAQVELSLEFPAGQAPGNLCLNGTRDTLYFLNKGIYRMAIGNPVLPASPWVISGTKNFYGLGVNPNDYLVYAADALDFNQRSNIYVFNAQGQQQSVFKAGINANGFYFE